MICGFKKEHMLNALELQKILKYDVRNIEKDYYMLKLQLIPLHSL